DLLDPHNTASDVWADTAYRSKESEKRLAEKGLRSRIPRRASQGTPLSQRAQEANRRRSKVRSRVEHVFGHQHTSMGGTIVRTIGLIRAKAKVGLMNLVYHISRVDFLERTATPRGCPPSPKAPFARATQPRLLETNSRQNPQNAPLTPKSHFAAQSTNFSRCP